MAWTPKRPAHRRYSSPAAPPRRWARGLACHRRGEVNVSNLRAIDSSGALLMPASGSRPVRRTQMNLRATHHGYAYQDLITGIALVDLMLGTADTVTVDTKGFTGDRFDDLTIVYRTGRRVRIQIKHTSQDRELSKDSFSEDGRSLRLGLLFRARLSDLDQYPGSMYRILVRDGSPDNDLAVVLKPIDPAHDPGDPLPGVTTRRF